MVYLEVIVYGLNMPSQVKDIKKSSVNSRILLLLKMRFEHSFEEATSSIAEKEVAHFSENDTNSEMIIEVQLFADLYAINNGYMKCFDVKFCL